jgi:mitochondrial fission protein ELM1
MKPKNDIWVLIDDRLSNKSQALGFAEALFDSFVIKNVEYNFLIYLPNIILGSSLMAIKNKKDFENDTFPRIVVSCGRRTASVALYIKKHSPKTKIIQILHPNAYLTKFDLIILPQHDKANYKHKNIVYTVGALNRINKDFLKKISKNFREDYKECSNFLIGVVIGGNAKGIFYDPNECLKFAKFLEAVANHHHLQLLITFSRRTPNYFKEIIYKNIPEPHVIYDPEISTKSNPYPGFLNSCKYVVVTADSISMLSEIASSTKPLYVYKPFYFNSSKHQYFLQQLLDLKIIRQVNLNATSLESYEKKPLEEIKKLKKIIKEF